MNFISFSPLYVNNLTIAGVYSLSKSTIELAKPVVAELGTVAAASLSQVETAQLNLGASMNKSQKSALSPDLTILDKGRDGDIREINRVTATYIRSSDEIKKSAASTMQLFLTPYKGVARQPINIETATVSDMVAKYKARPDLIAAAKTLGIDSVFSSLEAKNTELNVIYQSRNAEYSERDVPASELKPASITAYMEFCTAIEQANRYTASDTITALFYKMDELRKKYHALEGKKDIPTDAIDGNKM